MMQSLNNNINLSTASQLSHASNDLPSYDSDKNQRTKLQANRRRENQEPWKNIFESRPQFRRYFTVKSKNSADLRKLNIFNLDDELNIKLDGEHKKTTENNDGSLTIEVISKQQGDALTKINELQNEPVTVEPHEKYNESQGVITCDILRGYSDDDILQGLRQRGVKKVYRFKKKIGGLLADTDTILLTFDTDILPSEIKIRTGLKEKVRPYFPLPKRSKCGDSEIKSMS